MRFMLMIKADANSEGGKLPTTEEMSAMHTFNEQMVRAGVLLAADGLHPSSKGARVHFLAGKKTDVVEGPFPDPKAVVAGFWLVETKSKAEVIEWVKRCPLSEGHEIEIRQVYEVADFPEDVLPPEEAARIERMHAAVQQKTTQA